MRHLARTYSDYTLALHADFVQVNYSDARSVDGKYYGVCIFADSSGSTGGHCAVRDDDEGHHFYSLTSEEYEEASEEQKFDALYFMEKNSGDAYVSGINTFYDIEGSKTA